MFRIFITLLLLLLLGSAYAATFNVSTTAEFRQALADSRQNSGDDTIILAGGTYKTTDDGGGTFSYIVFGTQAKTLTIKGENGSNVILSGDNQDEVLDLCHEGVSTNIENITIQNGYGSSFTGLCAYDLTMNRCNFFNNNKSGSTSSMLYNSGGDLNISNSNFSGNNSAFDIISTAYSSGESRIVDTNISNNSVNTNNYILALRTKKIFIDNVTVQSNGNGGLQTTDSNEFVVVNNSKFIDNNGIAIFSDGQYLEVNNTLLSGNLNGFFINRGNTDISNTTIQNSVNQAIRAYTSNTYSLNVSNSYFIENNSAIDLSLGNPHSLKIFNSMFLNNSVEDENLINVFAEDDTEIIIENSSFIGTTGNSSNNLFWAHRGSVDIVNSIFYDNSSALDVSSMNSTMSVVRNSYIDIDKIDTSFVELNNIFDGVSLGFVDSSTDNYRLSATSDLIDAGTLVDINMTTTDLDGNPRKFGSSIDIGPYEYQPPAPPAIPTDLNASDGTIEYAVGISWNEAANTDYYNIYRSESQNEIGEIVGVSTSSSFVDDTIEENTKYYYRVNACNDEGCSDYSVADSGYIGTIAPAMNPAIIMYLLN